MTPGFVAKRRMTVSVDTLSSRATSCGVSHSVAGWGCFRASIHINTGKLSSAVNTETAYFWAACQLQARRWQVHAYAPHVVSPGFLGQVTAATLVGATRRMQNCHVAHPIGPAARCMSAIRAACESRINSTIAVKPLTGWAMPFVMKTSARSSDEPPSAAACFQTGAAAMR